jgi:two-component system, response regulator, stage 0 sporulation protein F
MITRAKVIYVDDEPINLQLFKLNFRRKYDVLLANDGFEGLSVLNENPDTNIIISDMRMPIMSGIEFITKAKEIFPDKNFYILTGFEITPEIQEAISMGLIQKYFTKPLDITEIDKTILTAGEQ